VLQQRVREQAGEIPFIFLVNKADLAAEWEISKADLEALTARGWRILRTSAKTGEGVEDAFAQVAEVMLALP